MEKLRNWSDFRKVDFWEWSMRCSAKERSLIDQDRFFNDTDGKLKYLQPDNVTKLVVPDQEQTQKYEAALKCIQDGKKSVDELYSIIDNFDEKYINNTQTGLNLIRKNRLNHLKIAIDCNELKKEIGMINSQNLNYIEFYLCQNEGFDQLLNEFRMHHHALYNYKREKIKDNINNKIQSLSNNQKNNLLELTNSKTLIRHDLYGEFDYCYVNFNQILFNRLLANGRDNTIELGAYYNKIKLSFDYNYLCYIDNLDFDCLLKGCYSDEPFNCLGNATLKTLGLSLIHDDPSFLIQNTY